MHTSFILSSLVLEPFKCWGYFHPKHKDAKIFENHLNLAMLAFIRWRALAEYSEMSTHAPDTFLGFFASFCIDQISHQQHKGK